RAHPPPACLPSNSALLSPSRDFFSIWIPSPPPSTPFPYTTLFRSGRMEYRAESFRQPGRRRQRREAARARNDGGKRNRKARKHQDRKSTRLNSSHLVISYAVFCLKKKNKSYLKYNMNRTL